MSGVFVCLEHGDSEEQVEAVLAKSSIESNPRLPAAESWTPQQVLAWAAETFGDRIALSTSFQVDGMVILDMAQQLGLGLRVMTIDTGRLPQETHELIDRVRDHYGIEVEVYHPDQAELARMTTSFGVNPFYKAVSLRMMCCEVRKVGPLNSVLSDLDAWITGVRRDHASSRGGAQKIEIDVRHGGIVKVNPLVDWTDDAVWAYVKDGGLPYNRLYDMGYTSIGCAPCTRAIGPGEDARDGRWWWERGVAKECGIHMSPVSGSTAAGG
jgi:thioredoxin-dependent adenylylsulfate APS reductase